MGDAEQKPTVSVDGLSSEGDIPLPPVYQQENPSNGDSAAVPPPKYATDKPMPLPTYDQSENYEKGGVLHISRSCPDEDISDSPPRRRWPTQNGSCFEFILFFIVCALFSVFGFLFSFCLATSTAAQSGAVAGLGTAFVTKPLLYELYYKDYEQQWTKNWCADYGTGAELQKCVHWSSTTMRTVFLIIGLFGELALRVLTP